MIALPNPYSSVGPVKCPSSMNTTQNQMTFTDALIAAGYVFDDENYDGCYVKQDDDGFIHLYQENVDDDTDTLWNYVKMNEDFDVIREVTFDPNVDSILN